MQQNTAFKNISRPVESGEEQRLSSKDWQQIRAVFNSHTQSEVLNLSNGMEFRFFALPHAGFTAKLCKENKDVAHFIWEEVSGLVNISHRIVTPEYRGQGIGSEMLYALEQRVQWLSNQERARFSLMIETSQESVVRMGLKRGMSVTQGKQEWQDFDQQRGYFSQDEKTHIFDENGNRVQFRLSKAFVPMEAEIINFSDMIRTQVVSVLKLKAA